MRSQILKKTFFLTTFLCRKKCRLRLKSHLHGQNLQQKYTKNGRESTTYYLTRGHDTQHNNTQHNDVQKNDTQRYEAQHYEAQNYEAQHYEA